MRSAEFCTLMHNSSNSTLHIRHSALFQGASMRPKIFAIAVTLTMSAAPLFAQAFPPDGNFVPGTQGSRNIKLMSHIPLGRIFTVTDVEVEQELSRPYA